LAAGLCTVTAMIAGASAAIPWPNARYARPRQCGGRAGPPAPAGAARPIFQCAWFGITTTRARPASSPSIWTATTSSARCRLANLPALASFDVENNQLSGSIPALEGLPQLFFFAVSANQLTESIPALSQAVGPQGFAAGDNRLSGALPSLAGLTSLEVFNVYDNQLSGPLPSLSD
jgi:hypothetical protein